MSELFHNAFSGVNLIPTILLGVVLLYWLIVILGLIDIDLFDIDLDFDLEGDSEGLQGILAFFNLKGIPVMVVVSIVALIFWILSMLLYVLPITPGGLLNGVLLIPIFIVSLLCSKWIGNSLKGVFQNTYDEAESQEVAIIGQLATVMCEMKEGRLGQAEIKRDGASIRINVKPEFEGDTFQKYEEAYVTKLGENDIYYIVKTYTNK